MLRPVRIALVGSLLAAVILGVPGAGSGRADAVVSGSMPSTIQGAKATAKGTAPAADPTLVVAPQEPVLLADAENYVFSVHLENPSDTALPAGTVRLRLHAPRIETTEDLAAARDAAGTVSDGTVSDGTVSDGTVSSDPLLLEVDVPETNAGGEQTVILTVPQGQFPLGIGSETGVYLVRAELQAGATADSEGTETSADPASTDPELVGTTTVVWERANAGDDGDGSLPLTIVVPFVLPEEVDGMPTPEELSDVVPRFNALLDAADRWRATLAVDPRIIAGIRAYGDAAPAAARDFLARLRSSVRPVFLLQFADADPAAQAALGYSELLRPTGLSYVTRAGTFPVADDTPAASDGGIGSGTDESSTGDTGGTIGNATEDDGATSDGDTGNTGADGEDPVPPSLDELLDWPTAQAGAWPAPGQVNAKTLALLQESGITSVVLESGNVTGNRTSAVELSDTRGANLDALVSDAGLAAAARTVLSATDDFDRAVGSAELVARLALGAENQSDGMVLALDRGAVADASSPATLFDTLDALEWLTATSASAQPTSSGRLVDGATTKERATFLRATEKRSTQIDELAPLLESPWYLTEYQRVRLLSAFATRYGAPKTDLAALSQARTERDEALLAGVQIVPSENTQLIGSSSRVPILVHNALPFDAIVTLHVAPTSAALVVHDRRFEEQQIGPGANSTVLVPVESRVSSGDASLSVLVADSVDDAVFSSALLRLTIRSSVETILLSVLAGLAALLFGFGIWRSVRRHRSEPAE